MAWSNIVLTLIGITFGIFLIVIGYFIYEEESDIRRYAKYGIVLIRDDHFQSLGSRRTDTTPDRLVNVLGHRASLMFGYLDRDGNGLLSATEMEPLIHLLRQNSTHHLNNPPPSCNMKKCLRVSVAVGNIDFSRALYVNLDNRHVNVTEKACAHDDEFCLKHLTNLTQVLTPVKDTGRFISHRHFLSLLPRSKDFIVGRSFHIVDSLPESDERFLGHREKVFDSYVEMHERVLAVILGHFKEGHVSLYPSTDPRFSLGIVRAKNSDYIEIFVRLLVEFGGSDGSDFVVVPGALVGRMVLRLADFQVVDFHLHQESDAILITLRDPSLNVAAKLSSLEMKSLSPQVDASDISWTEAISPKQAVDTLRSEMYNLKDLKFLSLSELAEKLESSNVDRRLILLLVCIGNIFDQTCQWQCPQMRLAMQNPKVVVKIRYEFTLASTTHFELKEMSRSENLSSAMRSLNMSVQPFFEPAFSFVVLSHDGKRVIGRTSSTELTNKTEKLLEPLKKKSDIEKENDEELNESSQSEEMAAPPVGTREYNAYELAREKRIKEVSSTSLLEFLDDALNQVSGS